jgi:hypothetical protein
MLEATGRPRCRERRRFRKGGRRYGYARFDWDFCDDLTQSDRASRLFESVSAGSLCLEMMLLIFVAGPMQQFRFGLSRHKYAT